MHFKNGFLRFRKKGDIFGGCYPFRGGSLAFEELF